MKMFEEQMMDLHRDLSKSKVTQVEANRESSKGKDNEFYIQFSKEHEKKMVRNIRSIE